MFIPTPPTPPPPPFTHYTTNDHLFAMIILLLKSIIGMAMTEAFL